MFDCTPLLASIQSKKTDLFPYTLQYMLFSQNGGEIKPSMFQDFRDLEAHLPSKVVI